MSWSRLVPLLSALAAMLPLKTLATPQLIRPDVLRGTITSTKLHIEFSWATSPNMDSQYAVEFEVHICPKDFAQPNWDATHPGKDFAASIDNVATNLGPSTYVDVFNYAKPGTADETWSYVTDVCKFPLLFPSTVVKYAYYNDGHLGEDTGGNFAVGIYDGSVLKAGKLYFFDLPLEKSVNLSGAYAWVEVQVAPRKCTFLGTFDVEDCPYFIGGTTTSLGVKVVDCGESAFSSWAVDICAPVEANGFAFDYWNSKPFCGQTFNQVVCHGSQCKAACQDSDGDGLVGTAFPWILQGKNLGDCDDDPFSLWSKMVGNGSYDAIHGKCSLCTQGGACPVGQACTGEGYCGVCEPTELQCADGIDNDCNGCTDSADKACGGCNDKQCGATSCGQPCPSTCKSPDKCNASTGKCEPCKPKCGANTCGSDGCGNLCGVCNGVCKSGKCCIPDCTNTTCGDNGCGTPCSTCPNGDACLADGTCPKPAGSSTCPTWIFTEKKDKLGWFVPSYAGKDDGIHLPDGAWLVNPAAKDPSIDSGPIAFDGSKCTLFKSGMSTNCSVQNACIYFKTVNKVKKPDGTMIDCTKLGEDHKVCHSTCEKGDWCNVGFDMSKDLCWMNGDTVTEIRFDYVDSQGGGNECSATDYDGAGFDDVGVYNWGNECAYGTGAVECYAPDTPAGYVGACKPGTRTCNDGYFTPCVGQVKPTAEVCDGQDNDCDGKTDEDGDAPMCSSFFVDNDGDGYGTSASKCLCKPNSPYLATSSGDCNDADGQIYPGKTELCDGVDNNCNGSVDEGAVAGCSDGLDCTTDSCTAGKCMHQLQAGYCAIAGNCYAASTSQPGQPCFDCEPSISNGSWSATTGTACDDQNPSTKDDKCENGVCAGNSDQCKSDSECKDDGDLCNGTPVCDTAAKPTKCIANAKGAVTCAMSKDTACQVTACDPGTGKCALKNVADSTKCDADGSACTAGDACKNGSCAAGPPLSCADDNECTDNSCDPKTGCVVLFNATTCTDGDACTDGDICGGGKCVSGKKKDCADGNPCTEDTCDKAKGCANKAVVDATICGSASCSTLIYAKAAACHQGACVGGTKNCDDGNLCTDDACDPAAGCLHPPNFAPCEDGSACTIADACSKGGCFGGPEKNCNDGEPCTVDSCDPAKGCQHAASANGIACGPSGCVGLNFTSAPVCTAGKCASVTASQDCNDGKACTDDACSPSQGCIHLANSVPCEDGDVCTKGDACAASACVPGPVLTCSDGNECTDDSCKTSIGCVHVANVNACDDGSACTTNDKCFGTKCQGISAACDDNNKCTVDTCSPTTGCQSVQAADGVSCDDGNACTTADACAAGKCKGTGLDCNDNNPCTVDQCDAKSQGCLHVPVADGASCSAASCMVAGTWQAPATCASGTCGKPPIIVPCDDGNACTADSCNLLQGCLHTAKSGICDDGNACTINDGCSGSKCLGVVVLCSDGNPCTTDSCSAASGACVYVPNSFVCDDGNACTINDKCVTGQCTGGILSCNDGVACTTDTCDAKTGCLNTASAAACNDSDPCTSDSCDVKQGCVHAPFGGPHKVEVTFKSPSPEAAQTLVHRFSADGQWASSSVGANVSVTFACVTEGQLAFNVGWSSPIGGQKWACDSDGAGGWLPAAGIPDVFVDGQPRTVALVAGASQPLGVARTCDFVVETTVTPPDIVTAPGKRTLRFPASVASNPPQACAQFLADVPWWRSGPVVEAKNGYFLFQFSEWQLPPGIWRFNLINVEGGCTGQAWAGPSQSWVTSDPAWTDTQQNQSAVAGAWKFLTLFDPDTKISEYALRMIVLPNGAILPTGNVSAFSNAAVCVAGSTRQCGTGCSSGLSTCLPHLHPEPDASPGPGASANQKNWAGTSWSTCVPATGGKSSDGCGNGDEDCDGITDEGCGDLIQNGSFESPSTVGWAGLGTWAVTTANAVDGQHAVEIKNASVLLNVWQSQLNRQGLPLVQGKTYRLAFWMSASTPQSVSVEVGQDHGAYNNLGLYSYVDVVPGMRLYVFDFRALQSDSAQVAISTGWYAGSVFVDAMTLTLL